MPCEISLSKFFLGTEWNLSSLVRETSTAPETDQTGYIYLRQERSGGNSKQTYTNSRNSVNVRNMLLKLSDISLLSWFSNICKNLQRKRKETMIFKFSHPLSQNRWFYVQPAGQWIFWLTITMNIPTGALSSNSVPSREPLGWLSAFWSYGSEDAQGATKLRWAPQSRVEKFPMLGHRTKLVLWKEEKGWSLGG